MHFDDPMVGADGGQEVEQPFVAPVPSKSSCIRRACLALFSLGIFSLVLFTSLSVEWPRVYTSFDLDSFSDRCINSDNNTTLLRLPDSVSRGFQATAGVCARSWTWLSEAWAVTFSTDKERLKVPMPVSVVERAVKLLEAAQLQMKSTQQENIDLRRITQMQRGSMSVLEEHVRACEANNVVLLKAMDRSWPALLGEMSMAYKYPVGYVLNKMWDGRRYRQVVSEAVKDLHMAQQQAVSIVHEAAVTKTTLETRVEQLEKENADLRAQLAMKDEALAVRAEAVSELKRELAQEKAKSTQKLEKLSFELQAMEAEADEIAVLRAEATELRAAVAKADLKARYALADKLRFEKRLMKCGAEVESLKARLVATTEAPVQVRGLEKAMADVLAKLGEQGQAMQHIKQQLEHSSVSSHLVPENLSSQPPEKVSSHVAEKSFKADCEEQLFTTNITVKTECEQQLSSVAATSEQCRERLQVVEADVQELHRLHEIELSEIVVLLAKTVEEAMQAHSEVAELSRAGPLGAEDGRLATLAIKYSTLTHEAGKLLSKVQKLLDANEEAAAGQEPA